MHAGCEKLKIDAKDCQLVLEEDGTEIDEDVDIIHLAGSTFILLEKGQCWSNASPATETSTSVPQPQPSEPVAAPSEHSQAPSTNMSKTFRIKNNTSDPENRPTVVVFRGGSRGCPGCPLLMVSFLKTCCGPNWRNLHFPVPVDYIVLPAKWTPLIKAHSIIQFVMP